MDNETLKVLGDLSAITIAAIALLYIARAVFSRSKSDGDTIKVFADLLGDAFKEVKTSVISHNKESGIRHGELLQALRDDMALTRQLIDAFSKSEDRVNKSIQGLTDNVGEHIRKVEEVGGNIMEKVTPLDQVLAAIHDELKLLRVSVDTHLSDSIKFRDDVIAKTESMESRLLQVESRVTQEAPAIKPIEEVVTPQIAETKTAKDKTS